MKVLMVCSGGMSSTIVVKAIEKEAQKQNFPLEINAIGTTEYREELQKGGFDLVIVAPQVKHRLDYFKELGEKNNVPVELIPPMGYTPIGAPKVLNEIIKKYEK
ncbi:PTS sugar transporter subunit IIB [Clostridium sp. MSJ-4]|uniref:PTS sugar transporter subunit IIB n=1 Tax=Clostridium simiarum TaxID=2841506 RepID=A0ABS6F220_9CLOT|nr:MULTISPECIES: PTS sugar transporter subunit IIB [Clostridium]MBU5592551.1 PTS sugar transporter subunit IIB [Clostridium simiarum]